MDTIPTAKNPCDVICFFPLEFPSQDGAIFMFLAMDVVSQAAFRTGSERSNSIEHVLQHIGLLMHHEDFKRCKQPFTLVLHDYEEHRDKINAILKPHGGTVAFNADYLEVNMEPLVEHLYSNFTKRVKEEAKKQASS